MCSDDRWQRIAPSPDDRGAGPPRVRLLDSASTHWRAPAIDLNAAIESALGPITLVLAGLLGLALVAILLLTRRLGRLEHRIASLTRGREGDSLETVLRQTLDRVDSVAREVVELEGRTTSLEVRGRRALQRLGLVRFNPFEDTGSNQSFAIAILDADDDGVILSSLHARSGTRIYAKSLVRGATDLALSAEESEALQLAKATRPPEGRASQ